MYQSKPFCSVDTDTEFPYKILIGANKEIELFNVRPSFVFRSPTAEMKKFFLSFRLLVQLIL